MARSYCVIIVQADVPCEQAEKSAKFSSVARNFCLGVPKIYYVFSTFYMKPQQLGDSHYLSGFVKISQVTQSGCCWGVRPPGLPGHRRLCRVWGKAVDWNLVQKSELSNFQREKSLFLQISEFDPL